MVNFLDKFSYVSIFLDAQSDYILKGLNLFKSMGLKGCWLAYWNAEGTYYGIRGRITEQKVGEWIAQYAS